MSKNLDLGLKIEEIEEIKIFFTKVAYKRSMSEYDIWGSSRSFCIEDDVKKYVSSGIMPEYVINH